VQRLELVRIRVCKRCGRGNAELRGDAGAQLVVRVDPVRVRELQGIAEEMRSLSDVLLEQLAAAGFEASEVVLDSVDGRLRGLVSLLRDDEVEVVGCTPEEGLTLAVRGGVRLYATDEAVAQAAPRRGDASGGPDTVH
jgi:hypothetical protein